MTPPARAQGFAEGEAVYAWSASENAWVRAVVEQVIHPADGAQGGPLPFAVGSVRLKYCDSAKEKWIEPHLFGQHLARRGPTPGSLTSNSTLQAGAAGFQAGEAVRVWSASDAAWADAVVAEVAATSAAAPAGGQHTAGSIRVTFAGGAKGMWIRAEQLCSSVQRVLSTPVGRLAPGSAVSVWSNSENAWMDAVISEMVLGDSSPPPGPGAGAAAPKPLEVSAVKVTYAGGTKMKLVHAREFPSCLRGVDQRVPPTLCGPGQLLGGAGPVDTRQQDEPVPAPRGVQECDEGQALPAPWHYMRKKLPIPSISSRCMEQVNNMATHQHAHGDGGNQGSACQRAAPLRCPNGQHPMIARVSTEVLNLANFRAPTCCRCSDPICVKQHARYWCKKCDISYCMHCAGVVRREQGSDVVPDVQDPDRLPEIMPGDILYCGPDPMSIYHTILACSPLQPADPEITELIFETPPPGARVLQCYTIESTRSLAGAVTPWYSAISFLQWEGGPRGSTTKLVASMAVESQGEEDVVEVLEEPVPVKVLFHPLRGGGPDSLDTRTFREAVLWGASTAAVYGRRSAIRAFLCSSPVLEPGDFPDAASRAALLKELHGRWEQKPICASVCIKVWQMYFELAGRSTGHGDDEAAAQVLRWMPVYSDVTMPSELLRALTLRGWEFRHL